MEKISLFLSRFQKITPPDDTIREKVAEIVLKEFSVEINKKDISVKNSIVYIDLKNPSLKNEIFIRKKSLLKTLKDAFGVKSPKDIR